MEAGSVNYLYFVVSYSPVFITMFLSLIAIVIAIFKYRHLRNASIYSIVGFLSLIAACISDVFYFALIVLNRMRGNESHDYFEAIFYLTRGVSFVATAVGLIALMVAIFSERQTLEM